MTMLLLKTAWSSVMSASATHAVAASDMQWCMQGDTRQKRASSKDL